MERNLGVIVCLVEIVYQYPAENYHFDSPASLAPIRSCVSVNLHSEVRRSAVGGAPVGEEGDEDVRDLVEEDVGEHEDEGLKASVLVVVWVVGLLGPVQCRDEITDFLYDSFSFCLYAEMR